jgi:hypothetical protein
MCANRTDNSKPCRRPSRTAPPTTGHAVLASRGAWLIAGVVALVMVCIVVTSRVMLGHQPPAPGTAPGSVATPLAAEFTALEHKLHATMGLVVSAVGVDAQQLVLGEWASGPAWSTMKVPLIVTALGEEHPPAITDAMRAAITESDNAAAESIWEKLGDPITAAHKVENVLRRYGDPTTVQWRKVRPQFTAFGQTIWSLTNQARFTAAAVCDQANTPVFTLMGEVENDQRWGLGSIPNTRFKGGWGPSPTHRYLVRQLGVLQTPAGLTTIAVATQPASGLFADGTEELTEVSTWLTQHLAVLPVGRCDH